MVSTPAAAVPLVRTFGVAQHNIFKIKDAGSTTLDFIRHLREVNLIQIVGIF